ncbi:MAG: hypothetical protein ABWX92_04420 [Mycetocola sp.]
MADPTSGRLSIGRADAGVSVVTLDGESIGTVQRVSTTPPEPVRRGYNLRPRNPIIVWYAFDTAGEKIARCHSRGFAVDELVEARRGSTSSETGGDA